MVTITEHAKGQLQARGIATPDEVMQAVARHEGRITRAKVSDVRVIVKRTTYQFLADGSNGDVVVACVTPSGIIKTVMLQRSAQVVGKSRDKSIVYFE